MRGGIHSVFVAIGVLVFLKNSIWLRNYVSVVTPIVSLNFKRAGCGVSCFASKY